ncbi:hypothetical protein THOM_1057 [Trachipleistophora hominis]|uniref:Uncharacterized protein n=1 Tax=Trachipleistophora hominis TaxID=72359 RepID=L7JYZ2_TRAHO|nr:hypothetical protein THOM_1057 [Trachipleistophora hominis]
MYILCGGKVKNEKTSQKPGSEKCVNVSKEIIHENNNEDEYYNYVRLINTEFNEISKTVRAFMDPVRILRTVEDMQVDFDTFKNTMIPTSYMVLMLCTISLREYLSNIAERRLWKMNGRKPASSGATWIAFNIRFKILTQFLNKYKNVEGYGRSGHDSTIREHSCRINRNLYYKLVSFVNKYEDLLKKCSPQT